MNNTLFFFMRSVLVFLLLGGCIHPQIFAEDRTQGESNDIPVCIATADTICETQYVEEVLELCKDCDIPAPEVTPPSGLQVWFTKWGIALFYRLHDAKDWISQKIFGDGRKELPPPPSLD